MLDDILRRLTTREPGAFSTWLGSREGRAWLAEAPDEGELLAGLLRAYGGMDALLALDEAEMADVYEHDVLQGLGEGGGRRLIDSYRRRASRQAFIGAQRALLATQG